MSNVDADLDNPYRAPSVMEVAMPVGEQMSDAVLVRTRHLKHEASLQGIGSLYVLGGILVSISLVLLASGLGAPFGFGVAELMMFIILLVVGVLQLAVGFGLRKVRPWTKVPATILAVLGLISFPIGTVLSGYVLYLLHSQKGSVVLAPAYQDVIAQTPEIKYRTSIIVKVLAIVLLVLIVVAVVAALMQA